MLEIATVCLAITALLAYVNQRFVGLPTTIGVMAIAMLLSLGLIGLERIGFGSLRDYETGLLRSIDFSELLMQGMLSVLLFAGALHIDLQSLRAYRWQVALLSVLGTTASTLIIGFSVWWLLPVFGLSLSLPFCLVFGALISPTDPIAVIGILKSANAPENVGVVVAGESLFNDGVGVVLFTLLLAPGPVEKRLRTAKHSGCWRATAAVAFCSVPRWERRCSSCSAASTTTRSRS